MGAPATMMNTTSAAPHHAGSSTPNNFYASSNNNNVQQQHQQQQQKDSLEATYTSLIQEYLQVMCLENATFLAERMVASCNSTNAWYLLAVCHYRSNSPQRALSVLENSIHAIRNHPPSAYLMAKCCFELQQFGRAEEALLESARLQYKQYKFEHYAQNVDRRQQSNNPNSDDEESNPMEMDGWIVESSPCPIPNGAAGLYLLGNICRRSNRKRRAMQYYRMSLQVRWVVLSSKKKY
jgi:anaphase-promoting complex subunit 3